MKKNEIAKTSKRRTSRATNRPLSPEKLLQSGGVRAATVPDVISAMASNNEYHQQPRILETNVNTFRNQQVLPGNSSMVSSPSYNQFFSQMYLSEMPNAQTVSGNVLAFWNVAT